MKPFNKLAFLCGFALLGLSALVGCEEALFYTVDYPDWLSERVDSIAAASTSETLDIDGMEDVYTIGETDYSSSWWTAFSKYYQVDNGEEWQAKIILYINPSGTLYYQNFALIISNDEDRDSGDYKEYGAIRFDATSDSTSYNSQWGSSYWDLPFKYTSATLLFSPDSDNAVDNLSSLGGTVIISVDRTDPDAFTVTMTNGTQTKTYAQPYALDNLNTDATNETIRCFLVPEGSYILFQETTIEPIGGVTSSEDKDPVSMVLENVPEQIQMSDDLDEVLADVTAVVTFEEDVTKTVTADELTFSVVPDMTSPGEKTLVAVYNKTYNGENCDTPVVASATITVISSVVSIEITSAVPTYYFYTTSATSGLSDRTLAFDSSNVVVTATYEGGDTGVLSNSLLTFPSTINAEAGQQEYTVRYGDLSATSYVNVEVSTASQVYNSESVVGEEDNSTGWWTVFSDDFTVGAGETKYITFTNYSSGEQVYHNYAVILRTAAYSEYAVVRADNYGWGGTGYNNVISDGYNDSDWLTAMDGATVTVYVTNCNNSTADVQCVVTGNDGVSYPQYYLGIDVDASDLTFALTVEGGHLVF